jgi:hypothetical protein
MRTGVTFALVLVLVGLVAMCPALACFSGAASHPCCPRHHAGTSVQNCPSQILETGKMAPACAGPSKPVSAVALIPSLQSVPQPVVFTDGRPDDLFLLVRSLRI